MLLRIYYALGSTYIAYYAFRAPLLSSSLSVPKYISLISLTSLIININLRYLGYLLSY